MLSNVDEVLAHAGVYDPAARRQRYLENRQLKGRKPGQAPDPGHDSSSTGPPAAKPGLHTVANQAVSSARQVAALQARLSTLKAALQKLLAEAESSSSSDSTSSSSTKKGGESPDANKPQTAKQKAASKKALEEAQKERAKEAKKNPEPKKAEPTKAEKIAHLRSVIADVQTKLRAALEKARNQTASNGR